MARKRSYPENILHDLQVDGVTEDVLKYDHLTERERAVIQKYNRPDELAGILEDTFTLWDAE